MKINYFHIAYKAGLEDVKSGKSKDPRRQLPKLKSLLPFVGGIIFKTYMKGYHFGYQKGIKQLQKEKEYLKQKERKQNTSIQKQSPKFEKSTERKPRGMSWER